MVNAFYSDVTPGASGGQIMEAYTMNKQGVEVSTSASILIMSFIVYQICLITLGAVGLFFSNGLLASIATFELNINGVIIPIPTIVFTIAGFGLNVIVILMLFLMSYSHKIHNFILHRGINFFAKLKLIKNPEEKREIIVQDAYSSVNTNLRAFRKWYMDNGLFEYMVILSPAYLNERLVFNLMTRFARRLNRYGGRYNVELNITEKPEYTAELAARRERIERFKREHPHHPKDEK